MNEVRVVQFHPEHVRLMDLRGYEAYGVLGQPNAYEALEDMMRKSVQSGSFIYNGRIVFCAGFQKIWNGVFDVWMIPSAHLKEVPFLAGRTVKRYIENIARDFKASRIQTTSFDDDFHSRWMQFLGFDNETPNGMRKYLPDGKSMNVYARIF